MEHYLKQIAQNTQPRGADITLRFSGNTTILENDYYPPVKLNKNRKYHIALIGLETYYSIPNIQNNINNIFTYSTDNGSTWNNITFAEGAYEITEINAFLQSEMKNAGHWDSAGENYYITLLPNKNTLKAEFKITDANYQIDFTTANNLREILGFDSTVISGINTHSGSTIVNIMPVNSIFVECNIITGSYVNTEVKQILYSFFPLASPGQKIVEKPNPLIFHNIIPTEEIYKISLRLTDQNGKTLNMLNEQLTVSLLLKEM